MKHLPPFIKACIALHMAALVMFVYAPGLWPWLLGALILLHGGIAAAGLLPRCALLGPNLTRLPEHAARRNEVAITIDDGPDPEITPAVLAILQRYGASATFFCIGERAQRYPALCRQAIAEGHDVENHGQYHLNHTALSGPAGWLNEAGTGQATLEAITGRRPGFYRPIAGLRNPFLQPVLQRTGMVLASWTRRGYDTRQYNPEVVYARLVHRLAAGDVLLLHDGNAARTEDGRAIILEVLPRLLEELAVRKLQPVTLRQACENTR
jgi:peptidoglycan/xylan/chitin deacetylase (PgdA/CDA1 family)